jgi:hypothetical protein
MLIVSLQRRTAQVASEREVHPVGLHLSGGRLGEACGVGCGKPYLKIVTRAGCGETFRWRGGERQVVANPQEYGVRVAVIVPQEDLP